MEVQVQPIEDNSDPSILEDIRTLPKKLKNVASGSILVSDEPKQSKLKSKSIQKFKWILSRYFNFFSECSNIKSTGSKGNFEEVEDADNDFYVVIVTQEKDSEVVDTEIKIKAKPEIWHVW